MSDPHLSVARAPFTSTQEHINSALEDRVPVVERNQEGVSTTEEYELISVRKMLEIVFSHPVFQSTPDETFYLNILTNSDGNITGIIDRQGSLAVPSVRCSRCRTTFPSSRLVPSGFDRYSTSDLPQ
jgi:hypothetical protein